MSKLFIKNTVLVCADTYNYGGAVASLKKCMGQCEFEKVIYFTNIPLNIEGVDLLLIYLWMLAATPIRYHQKLSVFY